jgi:ABC-type Zn2+ transport system substrate-binding protein/surface adhesin
MSAARKNNSRYTKTPIQCKPIQFIMLLITEGIGKNPIIIDKAANR